MMHRLLLTLSLLLAAALGGGLWFNAGALVRHLESPAQIEVLSIAKAEADLGRDIDLELHGSGLIDGTHVWLVPEATQRLALTTSIKTWGNPHQLRRIGNRVYVANGQGGVLVLEVDNWERPRLVGSLSLPKQAVDIAVVGETLYIACGEAGLQVADFSDPAAPQLIAQRPLPGAAIALQQRDNLLFVACSRPARLVVVDTSAPRHPFLLAQIAIPAPALDIALSEETILLACGTAGIIRFDIANPWKPTALAPLHPTGFVRALEGNGPLVYVGSYEMHALTKALLSVYDCSDPQQPRLLTEQPLSGNPYDMQLEGRRLTIAEGNSGVSLYDVANPRCPELLDTITSIGIIRGAIGDGDWLLLADGTGFLHVLRRSARLTLPTINTLPITNPTTPTLLQNGRLLLPLRNDTLQIYAAEDEAHPQWLADLQLPGNVDELAMRDDLLLISIQPFVDRSPQGGMLQIVSLADPTHPRPLARLKLPAPPQGMVFDGQRILLATPLAPAGSHAPTPPEGSPRGYLSLFDLSLPERPTLLTQLPLAGTPTGMVWQDGHALIALAEGGLLSVRVAADGGLTQAGSVAFPWLHHGGGIPRGGIKMVNGIAVVYAGASELSFIDVSAAGRPFLLGTGEAPGFVDQLVASDGLLYVGISSRGIMLYDLTLPWQPRQAGFLPLPWSGNSFVVGDEVLWFGGTTRFGLTCIPKPILNDTRSAGDGESLLVQLRSPVAAGDYSLWVERDNLWQELPNAVRFDAR